MKKPKWRKRVHGTKNQVGKPFILDGTSQQTKKSRLPKIKGKAITRYPTGKTVRYTIEDMPIHQLDTQLSIIQDANPENFEARVQHFIKMYQSGETIPPILYHKLPDGTIQLLDGRARLEAFRRLGIPRIPAVENGILSSIKSGLTKAFQGFKGFSEGTKTDKGKWASAPTSTAQAVGRRIGSDIRKHGQTAKGVLGKSKNVAGQVIEHGKAAYNFIDGQGTVVKGKQGGGDMIIPPKGSAQMTLNGKQVDSRPCVVEKKVRGKTFYTYGTLLNPETHPLALMRHGYTDVKEVP